MIPPLDPLTGALPLGRHLASLNEVQQRFATTQYREVIWKDFLKVTTMVGHIASIAAVWLSGSYLTSKDQPSDIDSVYWVYSDYNPTRMAALNSLPSALRASQFRVDGFPVVYDPVPGATDRVPSGYLRDRGYWDDLWGRLRDLDPEVDKLCRRGYLEVIIDGYQ